MVTTLSERIENYLGEHEIDEKEFVRQMGYENINKGLRRLYHWMAKGLEEKEYPGAGEQLQGLANVLPASENELQRLIDWEKDESYLEQLEKRRQEPTYYLHIQKWKYVATDLELSGELSEEEAIEKARAAILQAAENWSITYNHFIAILNTPRAKNIRFDERGEITTIQKDCVSPGATYLVLG